MENHLHLLLWTESGGPGLSRLMRDLKRLAARRLFPDSQGIWEPRFDDVAVFSERVFRTKLAYIHNNPVRAGLATDPSDYEFSSARAWLKGDELPGVSVKLGF